jgi:hypothetical protein
MRSDRADELGARLRRDAARLAARYPAHSPRPVPERVGRLRSFHSFGPLVLASLTLLIIIAARWLPSGNESDVPVPRTLADASEQTIAIAVAPNDSAGVAAALAPADQVSSGSAPAPADASQWESPVFLLEVSDPELEALLDLWETDRMEPTRLSI